MSVPYRIALLLGIVFALLVASAASAADCTEVEHYDYWDFCNGGSLACTCYCIQECSAEVHYAGYRTTGRRTNRCANCINMGDLICHESGTCIGCCYGSWQLTYSSGVVTDGCLIN